MKTANVQNMLDYYNYFDSVMVSDNQGIIQYYTNFRNEQYDAKKNRLVGMHILDIHNNLTEETSSILEVLRSGKAIYGRVQELRDLSGEMMINLYSTLPIIQNGKITGAIDLSRCADTEVRKLNLISLMEYANLKKHSDIATLDSIQTISERMIRIKKMIPKIANTDSSVLVYGETGTGKQLVVEAIHSASKRKSKKFVSQNCAAIPSTLLESILFGTIKGSYTGAPDRMGMFEAANGGTIFLDEINSMGLDMQAKILKVVEDKCITRIGSTKPIPVNVKIISAVNENPMECVKKHRLREDLFYRLNVVQIDVPPLRERPEDIAFLAEHFIQKFNQNMGSGVTGLSQEVAKFFKQYDWPGNVRELQNVIEGAFNVMDSQYIEKSHLPQYIVNEMEALKMQQKADKPAPSLQEKLENYEKGLIESAISSSENLTEAANALGISKQLLNYKLKKFQLKPCE